MGEARLCPRDEGASGHRQGAHDGRGSPRGEQHRQAADAPLAAADNKIRFTVCRTDA